MRLSRLRRRVAQVVARVRHGRWWKHKTLVVGPEQPVDGDSLACTKALINFLRGLGLQAYTLPTKTIYPALAWIIGREDIHPGCPCNPSLTTTDLQGAFDATMAAWRADEIVQVDGQRHRRGFDSRGLMDYTIDHHSQDVGICDDSRAYVCPAPSTGSLLIRRFGICDPILAVSILTDTHYLRHSLPAEAIDDLFLLRKRAGLTNQLLLEYNLCLRTRKDPEIIKVLSGCDLRVVGKAVFAVLTDRRHDVHRGVVGELTRYFDHLCVVRGDGYASLRTQDGMIDVAALAARHGGGGHRQMAAIPGVVGSERIERLFADYQEVVTRAV